MKAARGLGRGGPAAAHPLRIHSRDEIREYALTPFTFLRQLKWSEIGRSDYCGFADYFKSATG